MPAVIAEKTAKVTGADGLFPEGTVSRVWFGGSFREHWSDDYTLLVSYRDRRQVDCAFRAGRWEPSGGDAESCEMLLRDDCYSYRKWIAFSDDGRTWTKPRLTDMGDACSLSCAVTLDDGTILLVTNPRGKGIVDPKLGWRDRDPLTISVSRDGLHFSATHTVREGCHKYKVKPGPRARGGSAQYPSAIVHEGFCYVMYSIGKEDIAVTRIPLAPLLAAVKR